jgi:prophage regulatory protein
MQSSSCERATCPGDPDLVRKEPIRILRLAQVLQVTGLGKTTVYELQSHGAFPMRVKITDYCVGWVEQDVQAWLKHRVALSDVVPRMVRRTNGETRR